MSGTEFSIVTAENEYISKPSEFSISRPSLWPSEASVKYTVDNEEIVKGKCLRAVYYRSMEFPKDRQTYDPGMAAKWDLGKGVEKLAIDRWKCMGIYKENNIKFFYPEIVLSGELDCIIKNPITNGLVGVEIKSYYGHFANVELCGSKRPPKPGVPKIENFLQAVLYKHKYREVLDEYRLYYQERGDGHRVEFEVGLSAEGTEFRPFWRQIEGPYWGNFSVNKVMAPFLVTDIHDRYKELIRFLKNKELPPRDYKHVWTDSEIEDKWMAGEIGRTKYQKWKSTKIPLGDWQCSYCDWSSQCRNDSIGE